MNILDILAKAGLEGLIPPTVNMPQGDIQPPQQNMGKQLLEYLAGNAMGQPTGEWVNPERQPGSEQPGIYAPPGNEWLLGEADAWHGSPHKFEKFAMSKVGTGEGAQAFGHGLYFTSKKGVAEHYAGMDKSFRVDKMPVREWYNNSELKEVRNIFDASSYLKKKGLKADIESAAEFYNKSPDMVERRVADAILSYGDNAKYMLKSRGDATALAKFEEMEKSGRISKSSNLYKTKLWEGKQETLLDWDKPVPKDIAEKLINKFESGELKLNESAGTRKFVEGLRGLDPYKKLKDMGYRVDGKNVYRKDGKKIPQKVIDAQKQLWESSAIYRDAGHFYRDFSHMLGSDRIASNVLNDIGIDGIRYNAGTLSGGGKGYSYVVFDEDAITMMERMSK